MCITNGVIASQFIAVPSDDEYKGDVFYTGKFGEDCCPWGDLDQLIQSLEAIAMDNNLDKKKLLITLRSHAQHKQGSSKDCRDENSNFGRREKQTDSKHQAAETTARTGRQQDGQGNPGIRS